jgi:hypothetical protein
LYDFWELPIRNEGVLGQGGRIVEVILVKGGGKGLREDEQGRSKVDWRLTLHTMTWLRERKKQWASREFGLVIVHNLFNRGEHMSRASHFPLPF